MVHSVSFSQSHSQGGYLRNRMIEEEYFSKLSASACLTESVRGCWRVASTLAGRCAVRLRRMSPSKAALSTAHLAIAYRRPPLQIAFAILRRIFRDELLDLVGDRRRSRALAGGFAVATRPSLRKRKRFLRRISVRVGLFQDRDDLAVAVRFLDERAAGQKPDAPDRQRGDEKEVKNGAHTDDDRRCECVHKSRSADARCQSRRQVRASRNAESVFEAKRQYSSQRSMAASG